MDEPCGCLAAIILVIVAFAFSFLCTAGLIWLICWAFGLGFSWKITFGIWLVLILARMVFKNSNN